MAYVKTAWENEPSESTPVNASNLNKIEQGIYNNSVNIGELEDLDTTLKTNLVGAINEIYNSITDSTGYLELPNGTKIQWGLLPISNFNAIGNYYTGSVTFDHTYINTPFVQCVPLWNGTGDLLHHCYSVSTTGAIFEISAKVGSGVMWLAIGK